MKKLPFLFLIFLFTGACTAQPQPTQDVGSIVNATLTALALPQGNPQTSPSPIFQATEIPQPQPKPTGQLVVKPTDPNTTPGRDYFPPMGTIVGKLSYPSSFIPSMRVAFFNTTDGSVSYTDLPMNQNSYSMDLPEGKYHIVAYPYDPNNPPTNTENDLAGGYTSAVPCGLSVNCTDHSLLEVTVVAGQTVTADPGDWYAPLGSFPPLPAP
jgi:hypothetical protein